MGARHAGLQKRGISALHGRDVIRFIVADLQMPVGVLAENIDRALYQELSISQRLGQRAFGGVLHIAAGGVAVVILAAGGGVHLGLCAAGAHGAGLALGQEHRFQRHLLGVLHAAAGAVDATAADVPAPAAEAEAAAPAAEAADAEAAAPAPAAN